MERGDDIVKIVKLATQQRDDVGRPQLRFDGVVPELELGDITTGDLERVVEVTHEAALFAKQVLPDRGAVIHARVVMHRTGRSLHVAREIA